MKQEVVFWRNHNYYRNLLRLVETDAGVQPVRFTEHQLNYFDTNESYRLRAHCPAGISIALCTDAAWLELDILVEGAMRNHLYAMATVGDGSTHLVACEPLGPQPRSVTFRFTLSPAEQAIEMRKVEIYLSQFAWLTIKDIRLSSGACVSPADDRPSLRLLCLGDSITQGVDSRNPAGTYAVRLARLLNAELLNQGVGGHDFDPASFDPELPFEPNLITIAYGVNDWTKNKSVGDIADNARSLLERVSSRYEGVPILLITPIWHHTQDELKTAGTLVDVRATVAGVGAGFGHVHVIDGAGLVPGLPRLFADGVHPTDEGFAHYATELHRHALRVLGC